MIPFIDNSLTQREVPLWYKAERLDYCEPVKFKEPSLKDFFKNFFKKK